MGKRGGWIGEHWYLWYHYDFKQVSPHENGLLIVTFLDDHFFRMKQTWSALSWLNPLDLDLKLAEQGPEVKGLLKNTMRQNLSYFIRKIPFLEYIWLRINHHLLPFQLKNAESEMADYINYLKHEYLAQYPNGRFVVSKMLGYSWTRWPLDKKIFFQQLKKRKIEVWDNSNLDDALRIKYSNALYIPRDSHPSALNHELQADYFMAEIKKSKH